MNSEYPLADYVVKGIPLRFIPPFSLGKIPIPIDVLDALISRYITGYTPGWADYDREEITPVRIKYHLRQDQLGKIGTIEIYKTGNQESEMMVNSPSYPLGEQELIKKHGRKELKKKKRNHQIKVIDVLFHRLSKDESWIGYWEKGIEKWEQESQNDEIRIHIDDIDSFDKVRNVQYDEIKDFLDNGRIELEEDFIQKCIEEILDVPLHKKDWGGEENDLYTSNLVIEGNRISTAFLLKGKGLKKRKLELSDCGKNGDQLIRLVQSPANLFFVQYVGDISENIIKDIDGKVKLLRYEGKNAQYCILDGQDTTRLLYAYSKL